ncbi:MAG: phenylalanine--tRNA ligase subunit beta [bacterium]
MRFTYNWLREFVDTPLAPEQIADRLPMLGFEVEEFASTVPLLHGIVAGKVLECLPHPKSGHLKLCRVDIGAETLEVICGAPNVATGQLVAVAPPGSTLPSGLRIEAKPILGVNSSGMICSESELNLSDDADRILVLNHHSRPGQPLRDIIEPDWVFDIAVTPNRPDVLGVIGIAREVALLTNSRLLRPKIRLHESRDQAGKWLSIDIEAADACPRYAVRILRHVEIKPSPPWLQKRLHATGVRSLSNLVDVTNYVMMETGQPLHAFDYERLEKGKIVVRPARPGEKFQTLDGREHDLLESDLLICDGAKPVGLAGVMGGLNSEVSETTRHVAIECAYFEPRGVRRTAKRCGLASEAARRFERGTDPNGIPFALHRAAQLMQMTAGGEIARGVIDVYPRPVRPRSIALRPKRAALITGTRIPGARMEKILTGLECRVTKKQTAWQVVVPTFRPDLVREIDLIEEIGRIYGYDHIPEQLHSRVYIDATEDREEERSEKLRQTMTGLGYDEASTFDLISAKQAQRFLAPDQQALALLNPLNEELSTLRPTLAVSLLQSLAYNLNRKNNDVWLYEIGSVFWKTASQQIQEERHLGAVTVGAAELQSWRGSAAKLTVYDIRGAVEILLQKLALPAPRFKPAQAHHLLEVGWEIEVGEKKLGWAGQMKPGLASSVEVDEAVMAFEINLIDFQALSNWDKVLQPIPKFPAVERDLAIVLDLATPAEMVLAVIEASGGPHLESARLFDLYTGNQVPAGKKSLAYALAFRAPDRTLRDEEVEGWQHQILAALAEKCGAVLRS